MILWVHSYLCSDIDRLWLCAFSHGKRDIEQDVITESGMTPARLKALYDSTLNSKPLPKQIVNKLYADKNEIIYELKKSSVRLTFFTDKNLQYEEIIIPKIIVCLSYFIKKTNKTHKEDIDRAIIARNTYLEAKNNGALEILNV